MPPSRVYPAPLLLAVAAGVLFAAAAAVAQSPFAVEVVQYVPGTGIGNDPLTGEPYNNPQAALGPPTVDSTGDGWAIPPDEIVPVVPVYAPARATQIVTIGHGGRLVLRFDHAVMDDPRNPYGIDFLVFGNANLELGGGVQWENGDPNATTVQTAQLFSEPGLVSLSQDGATWYPFSAGPYADDYAPTLGRVYDPLNPDVSIGSWNAWWGEPTDPTLPLDPALTAGDFAGWTVAEIAAAYGGSAGGTGFDLANVGLDWIRYVRIENAELGGTPEIDAVADVSPLRRSRIVPEAPPAGAPRNVTP